MVEKPVGFCLFVVFEFDDLQQKSKISSCFNNFFNKKSLVIGVKAKPPNGVCYSANSTKRPRHLRSPRITKETEDSRIFLIGCVAGVWQRQDQVEGEGSCVAGCLLATLFLVLFWLHYPLSKILT